MTIKPERDVHHGQIPGGNVPTGSVFMSDLSEKKRPFAVNPGSGKSASRLERLRPPLGLAQILVWITCIAACLAIVKGLVPREPSPLGVVIVLPHIVAVATAWAGLVLLTLHHATDTRWAIGPGHWLLGLLGVSFSVELGLRFVPSSALSRPDVVLNAVTCWLFVLPLFSRRMAFRWKAFFGLTVLLYAGPLLLGCMAILGLGTAGSDSRIATLLMFAKTPVLIGALVATCLLDRRDGVEHDWLDGCGLAVFLWAMMHALVQHVWS